MEDCLKSRCKVYHLPSAIGEERVNDYNPLLLHLWKANMDLQYVGDVSLALHGTLCYWIHNQGRKEPHARTVE